MSGLFEGWNRATLQQGHLDPVRPEWAPSELIPGSLVIPEPPESAKAVAASLPETAPSRGTVDSKKAFEGEIAKSVMVQPPETSRLVAWTGPNSLVAEKFRALAVRLGDMRRKHQLNSLQVTSSVISEGKSFVAANLAVTLARYSGSKTLLIEGDLHRPTLGTMFGLKDLQGLSDWWSAQNRELASYLLRFTGTGLWFLPAGKACDRPSEMLRSAQLAEAFAQLSSRFDWIVDGTLLVVREGVAPLKALKNGLQSLDNPKLIGVVVNEASEFDQVDYDGQYYRARTNGDNRSKPLR
jgi:hypothetical protein